MIGHHTQIKENSVISPNCFFGGNSKLGKNSFIASGSVVLNSIKKNSKVIGNPARVIGKND